MHRFLVLLPFAFAAAAEPAPPAPAEDEKEPASWVSTGRFGALGSNVIAAKEQTSRDPTIAGTTETYGWRLALDAGLDFRAAPHSVDQKLIAKYGRKREQEQDWVEDVDEVRYDGVYRYSWHKPHFSYVSWGWESVFTGPPPEERAFNPGLLKAGAGYGQLYEDLLPVTDKLEGRVGASVRKRYGSDLAHEDTEPIYGGELFLRYERKQTEMLRYFAQYEGFLEFEDPGHVISVVTAGLTANLTTLLTLDVAVRGYHETRPEDEANGTPGYNEWSGRQETLLGLTWIW